MNRMKTDQLTKVIFHIVDFVALMGRAHKQISAQREERLKPVLNENIRTLLCKKIPDLKYLFRNNLLESMKGAKEFQIVLSTTTLTSFRKLVTNQDVTIPLGSAIMVLMPGFVLPIL